MHNHVNFGIHRLPSCMHAMMALKKQDKSEQVIVFNMCSCANFIKSTIKQIHVREYSQNNVYPHFYPKR